MANTSSRTLRLLSLLQAHRHWQGSDLADRLGVSVRTLRRDIDRLRDLGYPVRAQRGVGGGYELAPGAALPPLVLDDEEAVALALTDRAISILTVIVLGGILYAFSQKVRRAHGSGNRGDGGDRLARAVPRGERGTGAERATPPVG